MTIGRNSGVEGEYTGGAWTFVGVNQTSPSETEPDVYTIVRWERKFHPDIEDDFDIEQVK